MSTINTGQPSVQSPQRTNPTTGPSITSGSAPASNVTPLTTSTLGAQTGAQSSPTASAGVTDSQGHTARMALGNANAPAAGGLGLAEAKPRGANTYDQHGNKPVNINTPEGRRTLIASSPQLDNNDKTTTDSTRCGGAAMFNAMVADGKPAKNADAIAKVADGLNNPDGSKFQLNDDQKKALAAMKSGTMTANQAAVMQELMSEMTKRLPETEKGAKPVVDNQVTVAGMTMMASRLKEMGAFSNSSSVRFTGQQNPDGGGRHWTMSQQDLKGNTTSADSWPNEFGHAKVSSEDLGPNRLKGNPSERNPNYSGEVSLMNLSNGQTRYDVHQYPPKGSGGGLHLTTDTRYAITDPLDMTQMTDEQIYLR